MRHGKGGGRPHQPARPVKRRRPDIFGMDLGAAQNDRGAAAAQDMQITRDPQADIAGAQMS